MLSKLTIRGFKSIKDQTLELKQLNVLIGANGAGKSNFISFFKLLNNVTKKTLQQYVDYEGGSDSLLYYGRKETSKITTELYFGDNRCFFEFRSTKDNRLSVDHRISQHDRKRNVHSSSSSFLGHDEVLIPSPEAKSLRWERNVFNAIENWKVYHFHDTGDTAAVKKISAINDNEYLRPDAENLAAYLYLLKDTHPKHYNMIVETIRLVAPFFGDFHLRPTPKNKNVIQLEWREKNSAYPFLAHQLSDGTLRFICLATLLLQPSENMPATIIIDEPELGLHPYAVELLASLIESTSKTHQIILATQSVALINQFEVEDIVVVDRQDKQSTFRRLIAKEYKEWLKEYSLGELWEKNIFGGNPV